MEPDLKLFARMAGEGTGRSNIRSANFLSFGLLIHSNPLAILVENYELYLLLLLPLPLPAI